ncbi:MAG TPA: PH domain-containing protein [Candidatus Saccharimonadales bacterium]|nr:PH domain-containing protein [Candidatus Saccharimonadales bacterium]
MKVLKPPDPSFKFETQEDEEEVLLLLRAHLITNVGWIIAALILSALPLIFTNTNLFDPIFSQIPISSVAGRSLIILWYLFVLAFIVQNVLSWYFNVYVVTNLRIVDFDFLQLLYKKISSTELEQIEDVTTTKGGIAQTLFDYGDLRVQTAGTSPEFEFTRIPNPDLVQNIIEEAMERVEKSG